MNNNNTVPSTVTHAELIAYTREMQRRAREAYQELPWHYKRKAKEILEIAEALEENSDTPAVRMGGPSTLGMWRLVQKQERALEEHLAMVASVLEVRARAAEQKEAERQAREAARAAERAEQKLALEAKLAEQKAARAAELAEQKAARAAELAGQKAARAAELAEQKAAAAALKQRIADVEKFSRWIAPAFQWAATVPDLAPLTELMDVLKELRARLDAEQ